MGRKFWTFLGWPLLILPQLILLFGLLLNALVMNANKGMMPVTMSACLELDWNSELHTINDDFHLCEDAHTRLRKLDDWIRLGNIGVYSPGDAFIFLGDIAKWPLFYVWLTLLVVCAMNEKKFYLESSNG